VLQQAVLALERTPPGTTLPPFVDSSEREEPGPVPIVAATFLGGAAGLAQRVAAEAAALLERELVEGLLLIAVPAALALLFHQHTPASTIEASGEGL
jgi:hypothetical protein